MQAVTHGLEVFHIFSQVTLRNFTGFAQSDDFQDVFSSSPVIPFMPGPMHKFFQLDPMTDKQCPNTFRGIELVSSNRQQIYSQLIHLYRNFSD